MLENNKTKATRSLQLLNYQKPILTEYGSVAFLTKGTGGSRADNCEPSPDCVDRSKITD